MIPFGLTVCLWTNQPWLFTLGFLAGVSVTLANFLGTRPLPPRMVGGRQRGADSASLAGTATLLFAKLLGTVALVGVAIFVFKLDPIAFGLGVSLVVGTYLMGSLFISRGTPAQRTSVLEPSAAPPGAPATSHPVKEG